MSKEEIDKMIEEALRPLVVRICVLEHRVNWLEQESEESTNGCITIEYIDGTKEHFPETSRSGGSYCTSGKAEMGWYTVTDAYGNRTRIPAERIKVIRTSGGR